MEKNYEGGKQNIESEETDLAWMSFILEFKTDERNTHAYGGWEKGIRKWC